MEASRPAGSNPRDKIECLTLTSQKSSYVGVPGLRLRKERVGVISEAPGDLRGIL